MFNGIKLKTSLPSPREGHALLIGLFEVLCPWRPCLPICSKSKRELRGEYHYYLGGRVAGFVALVLLLLGIAKFILEVFL